MVSIEFMFLFTSCSHCKFTYLPHTNGSIFLLHSYKNTKVPSYLVLKYIIQKYTILSKDKFIFIIISMNPWRYKIKGINVDFGMGSAIGIYFRNNGLLFDHFFILNICFHCLSFVKKVFLLSVFQRVLL